MDLTSPPSLYSLATRVVPSQYFAQVTPKLEEILPTSIFLDVLLQKCALESLDDIRLVNGELSRFSTFSKLLSIKGESINLVRGLCKLVSNAGIGEKDLFPERLAAAFENEVVKENSKLIEDGVLLGEFLHEGGFKASATILKLCLEHCEKAKPSATKASLANMQRKIIVTLLQAQVRHSMCREAQSTREQALEFIEKWKLSGGVHYAELYSALASLSLLEGNFCKSYELSNKGLKLMNASEDYYATENGATIDILAQATLSRINYFMSSTEEVKTLLNKGLSFARCKLGQRSPQYADMLAISYQYFKVLGDSQRAAWAAKECWEIRMEAFGSNNVLTESARKNMIGALLGFSVWHFERGLLQL